MSADTYHRIWGTVAEIPYGKVATYGQVARVAGLGRRARLVGYALHSAPEGMNLPWHRVVNSQGRISFPAGSCNYRRQRRLLEAEAIVFTNGRLNLAHCRWEPASEGLPPEYLQAELEAEYQNEDC